MWVPNKWRRKQLWKQYLLTTKPAFVRKAAHNCLSKVKVHNPNLLLQCTSMAHRARILEMSTGGHVDRRPLIEANSITRKCDAECLTLMFCIKQNLLYSYTILWLHRGGRMRPTAVGWFSLGKSSVAFAKREAGSCLAEASSVLVLAACTLCSCSSKASRSSVAYNGQYSWTNAGRQDTTQKRQIGHKT